MWRFLLLTLTLSAIGIWFWLHPHAPPPPPSSLSQVPLVEKTISTPTPHPSQPSAPTTTPPPSPSQAQALSNQLYQQNLVPFRRAGDRAIGFGDVVLGRLNPDLDAPDTGATDAPDPKYWAEGIVPYRFSADFKNPERVNNAIQEIQAHSAFRFIPHESEPDFIIFTPDEECLSYLGRIGGGQEIFLGERCGKGEVVHELMHALGLIHEHSRFDRDDYVEVNWEAIEPGKELQFSKLPEFSAEIYTRLPFDYTSILIYAPTAFARSSGSQTLLSRTSTAITPSRDRLSPGDIEKLSLLYERTH